MRKIDLLKLNARACAIDEGHYLGRFAVVRGHTAYAVHRAKCLYCNASVTVQNGGMYMKEIELEHLQHRCKRIGG